MKLGTVIEDVQDEWMQLPLPLYGLPNWLKTAEALSAGRVYYGVARQEQRVVGGLVAYETLPTSWKLNNPIALLLDQWRTEGSAEEGSSEAASTISALSEELYPALVSVLPSGYLPGVIRTDDQAVKSLLNELERIASEHSYRTIAVMHVPEADDALRAALHARGYVSFTSASECVLHLYDLHDLDAYLAALPSARRRYVKKEIEAFDRSGMTVEELAIDRMNDGHALLHALHHGKYGHPVDVERSQRLIRNIQRYPTGRGRVLQAKRASELAGFVVFYELDRVFYPKMLGIDPQMAADSYVYYNLAYYRLIGLATQAGARAIEYGPESYGAKAHRGASLYRRINYIRAPGQQDAVARELAGRVDDVNRAITGKFRWRPGPGQQ